MISNFEEFLAESAITSDEEFEKYAMDRMKKKHPNDFDENIARKVIDDLKKKYDGNYGAMVGALR